MSHFHLGQKTKFFTLTLMLTITDRWTEAIDKVSVLLKDVMLSCTGIKQGPVSLFMRQARVPLRQSAFVKTLQLIKF